MNTRKREESLTLEILEAIEQRDNVTQRHLADRMGVALGLANSYMKRCVRKGLIKVHQAPANRFLYYLTPKGFAEKSRLTAEYLSSSFDFYRKAGNSCNEIIQIAHDNGWNKILFCGVSELAEIASAKMHEHGLTHIATYDPDSELNHFLGQSVLKSLDELPEIDAGILTSLDDTSGIYFKVSKKLGKEKILIPSILSFYGIN